MEKNSEEQVKTPESLEGEAVKKKQPHNIEDRLKQILNPLEIRPLPKKQKFTPLQLKYITLMADPTSKLTEPERMKKIGLDSNSKVGYHLWRKLPGFYDKVWEMFIKYYLQGELPAINKTLIEKAKKGHLPSIELVYKMAGKITEGKRNAITTPLPFQVILAKEVVMQKPKQIAK